MYVISVSLYSRPSIDWMDNIHYTMFRLLSSYIIFNSDAVRYIKVASLRTQTSQREVPTIRYDRHSGSQYSFIPGISLYIAIAELTEKYVPLAPVKLGSSVFS